MYSPSGFISQLLLRRKRIRRRIKRKTRRIRKIRRPIRKRRVTALVQSQRRGKLFFDGVSCVEVVGSTRVVYSR